MSLSETISTPMSRANVQRAPQTSKLSELIAVYDSASNLCVDTSNALDEASAAVAAARPVIVGVAHGMMRHFQTFIDGELAVDHPAAPHIYRSHEEIARCLFKEPECVRDRLNAALRVQIDEAMKAVPSELLKAERIAEDKNNKAEKAFARAHNALLNFKPSSLTEMADYLIHVGRHEHRFTFDGGEVCRIMRNMAAALRNGGLR